jgi:ubiquinone/menaquinone biosynthesis C-methylase UbiE
VIIQFGHNDVGPLDERGKFRGSVKGIGDQTEKVKKPDGSIEEVHSYGWYLREMARIIKEVGKNLCDPSSTFAVEHPEELLAVSAKAIRRLQCLIADLTPAWDVPAQTLRQVHSPKMTNERYIHQFMD